MKNADLERAITTPVRKLLLCALTVSLAACTSDLATVPPTAQPQPSNATPAPPPPVPSEWQPQKWTLLVGTPTVVVANSDGTHAITIGAGNWPSFSTNGTELLFERDGVLIIVTLATGAERRVGDGVWPAWSPDGSRIAYVDKFGLNVMRADGSETRTLVPHHFRSGTHLPTDFGVGKPAWSPDGALLAFEHLGDGEITPANVFIVSAAGGAPRKATVSSDGFTYAESDPSWTPAGDQLVLWSYGYGIALVGRDSGVQSSFFKNFPLISYGSRPQYSPDGKSLSMNSRGASSYDVHVIGPGYPDAITNAMNLSWSTDGQRVVFVRGMK